MTETWAERIERDIVEGKAVARGERRKADLEESLTPELCMDRLDHGMTDPPPAARGVGCLLPKGHEGCHQNSNVGMKWKRR